MWHRSDLVQLADSYDVQTRTHVNALQITKLGGDDTNPLSAGSLKPQSGLAVSPTRPGFLNPIMLVHQKPNLELTQQSRKLIHLHSSPPQKETQSRGTKTSGAAGSCQKSGPLLVGSSGRKRKKETGHPDPKSLKPRNPEALETLKTLYRIIAL